MEIHLIETNSKKEKDAFILKAKSKDMPTKKSGWQFTWRTLYKTEGAEFYKIILTDNSDNIEGMLMLSVMYDEMLYMNNIEVAPHNLGSKGKYDNVAGCLIAFGCL